MVNAKVGSTDFSAALQQQDALRGSEASDIPDRGAPIVTDFVFVNDKKGTSLMAIC